MADLGRFKDLDVLEGYLELLEFHHESRGGERKPGRIKYLGAREAIYEETNSLCR